MSMAVPYNCTTFLERDIGSGYENTILLYQNIETIHL